MIDVNGQTLNEGDQVLFPLGFGQVGVGQIIKATSGLATPDNPQAAKLVVVALQLPIQAQPNGVVVGIIKLGPPAPPVAPQGVTL